MDSFLQECDEKNMLKPQVLYKFDEQAFAEKRNNDPRRLYKIKNAYKSLTENNNTNVTNDFHSSFVQSKKQVDLFSELKKSSDSIKSTELKNSQLFDTYKRETEKDVKSSESSISMLDKNSSRLIDNNQDESYTVFEIYDDKIISKTKFFNSNDKKDENFIFQYQINL